MNRTGGKVFLKGQVREGEDPGTAFQKKTCSVADVLKQALRAPGVPQSLLEAGLDEIVGVLRAVFGLHHQSDVAAGPELLLQAEV